MELLLYLIQTSSAKNVLYFCQRKPQFCGIYISENIPLQIQIFMLQLHTRGTQINFRVRQGYRGRIRCELIQIRIRIVRIQYGPFFRLLRRGISNNSRMMSKTAAIACTLIWTRMSTMLARNQGIEAKRL
jgi:hypothetical protein